MLDQNGIAKYDQLSNLIKRRILSGDYDLTGLPAERQLATEIDVARMTVRRSLLQLLEEGFLVRSANGRLEVNRDKVMEGSTFQIAFLAPLFPSAAIERWRERLNTAAEKMSGKMRPVLYTHWDDPLIGAGLDNFDGVFLLPSSEPMPASTVERFAQTKRPLVVLDEDMSHVGLPSIRQSAPVSVQRLLDHLETQGCRKIACFNTQPNHSVVEERIEQWRIWMSAHHFEGELINEPVEAYAEPLSQAYSTIKRRIKEKKFNCDALLCITIFAAIGAMRAMHEAGIRPGIDVAVCAVGGEGVAEFQIPSVTAIEASNVSSYISRSLQWMSQGGGAWSGPLLMQPSEPLLVVRESTSTHRPLNNEFVNDPFADTANKENQNAYSIA